MTYTDNQLKQALAKMLPDKLVFISNREPDDQLHYLEDCWVCANVQDTELLHLCWLVEETLENWEKSSYHEYLHLQTKEDKIWQWHATWQQRVIAIAKVKGVEIV